MKTDLNTILLGGQAFNWDYLGNSYYGFTQKGIIKLSEEDNEIKSELLNEDLDINTYLGRNLDHEYIKKQIDKDRYIHTAIENIDGITILKQDFLQTTLSYILATNKNIPAIRKSIRQLSKKYGNKLEIDNLKIYTFPSVESIANADIKDLKETKIGYRAEYLKSTSKLLLENDLEQNIGNLERDEIRKELIKLPGIGPKVADCILLYSLGFLDVVPIDIWMFNIAREVYNLPFKKYEDISRWYTNYFGEYAGIAGQYLFEFYRSKPQ